MSKSKWQIPMWVRRLWSQPTHELTRWQRTVRYSVDLARHCAGELRHDKAGQMAAALTFHTLFSLLPTIVLAMVLLQVFVGDEEREQFKQLVTDSLLPKTQQVEEATTPPAPDVPSRPETDQQVAEPSADAPQDVPAAEESAEPIAPDDEGADEPTDPLERMNTRMDAVMNAISRLEVLVETGEAAEPPDAAGTATVTGANELTEAREEMAGRIEKLMDSIQQINFRGVGVVGLLVFIYGATALLRTMEGSFNSIFDVTRARPLYLRFPMYVTVILLGPVVLISGQFMQQQFLGALQAEAWTNWLAGPMVLLSPLLTMWAVLWAMFVLLPNTRVHRRAAAVGGFVSTVLLLIVKETFALYVANAAVASYYGAMALLPLFLLWLWINWLIVLFGLELTYTLGAMGGRRFKHEAHKLADQVLVDPAWVVPVAVGVAQAFAGGKTANEAELCRATNLPAHTVHRLLQSLINAQLVHRIDEDEESGYALARPAERIAAAELLAAAQQLLSPSDSGQDTAAGQFIERLHQAGHQIAEQTTLAELCKSGPSRT